MSDIITTLHPENDNNIDLYPNIVKENIPESSIDRSKLDDGVNNLLDSINALHPAGVDTSTNILAFTEDKGIWVGSDNGKWYYWDGTHYVEGGEFIANILLTDIANAPRSKIQPDRTIISDNHTMTNTTYYQENLSNIKIGDTLYFMVFTNNSDGAIGNRLSVRNRIGNDNYNTANFYYIGNGIYYLKYDVVQVTGLQILLWAYDGSTVYGVNIGINGIYNNDITYVDCDNGNDLNNGLAFNFAKKTISNALLHSDNLYVKAGIYNETIHIVNRDKISISKYNYNNTTYEDNYKVIIRNPNELLSLTLVDGLYESEYVETDTNSNLYKVFITHAINPIINVGGGTSNGYNATIFKYNGKYNSIALKPVLTKLECENESNTFYYDGSKIYIHTDDTTNYSYYLPKNYLSNVFYAYQCNELELNDIQFEMGFGTNMNLVVIARCKNVKISNCISLLCSGGTNVSTVYSNANFYKCESYQASADGFAPSGSGMNNFYDCIAAYNKDDGVSHHNGCCGEVNGGEYHHNAKGGIATPAHGAYVDIYNTYTHDNTYGIYITSAVSVTKPIKLFNNVIKYNTYGILLSNTYTVYSYNNNFSDNNNAGDYSRLILL